MKAQTLHSIAALTGVNTNAPRGTQPSPDLLQNVHLDRTGGYVSMPARSRRLASVTRAVYAAMADNLFTELSGVVNYWDVDAGELTVVPELATLVNAVSAMPDLLLTPTGWVYKAGPEPAHLDPAGIVVVAIVSPATALVNGVNYEFLVQFLPVPGATYSGTQVFTNPGAAQVAPYSLNFLWPYDTQPPAMRLYVREPANPDANRFVYLGSNLGPDGKLYQGIHILTSKTSEVDGRRWEVIPAPTDNLTFTVTDRTVTAYHQGRVFVAASDASYQKIEGEEAPTPTTDSGRTRIYFSNILATASLTSLPAFTLVNYFDVPFKVSRRVVALASVGPYLYIFGDRELFVMTGDPERDARVESVGDSIGAISPASVQQLSGVVYWQSDSGVLAVQGGTVKEVGEPVRDQLAALGLSVTSTVDFKKECYYLTDSVTILCYHARENGWTTRQQEGGNTPALLYGGGTPYMLSGGALYSIGGEVGLDGTPGKLNMTIRYPHFELGSFLVRKTFIGVTFGLDLATSSATVYHRSTVDGRTDQTADVEQSVTAGKAGAVKLHCTREGVPMSGAAISVEVEISTQDSRGIVRGPLVLLGNPVGEEMWTDEQ
jgi:hypothetical protein